MYFFSIVYIYIGIENGKWIEYVGTFRNHRYCFVCYYDFCTKTKTGCRYKQKSCFSRSCVNIHGYVRTRYARASEQGPFLIR
jgi:hypothetical protein